MPDIEATLEETVSTLHAAQRAKLLQQVEIREIVRKRRHHEYTLARPNSNRSDFLRYAAFERDLATELSRRAKKRGLKKGKVELIVGKTASRVNLVYSRAVRRFRNDVDLWLHYAKHCIKQGSTRTAAKVLAKALAFRSDDDRIWLAAISLHFDIIGDTKGARALAQRSLRANPHSLVLWKEYYRVEVLYLVKLTARRLQMGLGVPDSNADPSADVENYQNHEKAKQHDKAQEENDQMSDDEDEEEEDKQSYETPAGDDQKQLSLPSTDKSKDHPPLSFWDGGVPFTVFKKTLDAIPLDKFAITSFYDIASTSLFVSPRFLEEFCREISSRYSECPSAKLLDLRKSWDMEYTKFRRQFPENAEKKNTDDSENTKKNEQYDFVEKETESITTKIHEFLTSSLKKKEEARDVLIYSARGFLEGTREFGTSKATKLKLRELKEYLDDFNSEKRNGTEQLKDAVMTTDPNEDWDLTRIKKYLSEVKSDNWEADKSFIEVFNKKIMAAYRNKEQDDILSLFLSKESSKDTIRNVIKLILQGSPRTVEILRAAISAEVRLWESISDDSQIPHKGKDGEMESQIRKLFNIATELSAAKIDQELWLEYIDFERRIVRNSKAAALVHGKALSTLSPSLRSPFSETLILRSLKR